MPVIPFGLSVALLLGDAGIATSDSGLPGHCTRPNGRPKIRVEIRGGGWDRTNRGVEGAQVIDTAKNQKREKPQKR